VLKKKLAMRQVAAMITIAIDFFGKDVSDAFSPIVGDADGCTIDAVPTVEDACDELANGFDFCDNGGTGCSCSFSE